MVVEAEPQVKHSCCHLHTLPVLCVLVSHRVTIKPVKKGLGRPRLGSGFRALAAV